MFLSYKDRRISISRLFIVRIVLRRFTFFKFMEKLVSYSHHMNEEVKRATGAFNDIQDRSEDHAMAFLKDNTVLS